MTVIASKLAVLEHRLHDDRAGEDEVGAGVLDALDVAALVGRHVGEALDEVVERARGVISKPWMPPSDGRPASAWIAAARLRIVPPMPTIRRPARGSHVGVLLERLAHVRAQRLARLLRRRVVVGEEVLGHPHGAQRPRAEPAGVAAEDLDELQRAAAEVEHGAVGERRRVDRREVAVVGLLLAAEDAHLEAGLVADALEEDLPGWTRRGSRSSRRPGCSRGSRPVAAQKCAKTSAASSARFIGALPSLPVASSPSPMRTGR